MKTVKQPCAFHEKQGRFDPFCCNCQPLTDDGRRIKELEDDAKYRARVNNALCEALRQIAREPAGHQAIALSILYDIDQLPEQFQTPAEKERDELRELARGVKKEAQPVATKLALEMPGLFSAIDALLVAAALPKEGEDE